MRSVELVDLLVPPACAGCGSRGSVLCAACLDRIRPATAETDRFVVADAGVVIGDALLVAIAACAYGGPLRRALAALKYTGVRRLAPVLAELTLPALHRVAAISGGATLVPVPIHGERRAVRGYNQAQLIAAALGRHTGHPVAEVLVRRHATTKQHRLNRSARLANLRDAFAVSGSVPAVAIVVDDIITTSATLEACAAALTTAGCEAVYGVAVAREV